MHVIFRFLIITFSLLLSQNLFAQRGNLPEGGLTSPTDDDKKSRRSRSGKGSIFLNDSTQQVYGPTTTLFSTEEDLFYNRKNFRILDTTILNLHRWGYIQRFNYRYQDLGNVGTALNPIYPAIRDFSGAVSGFESFRPFYETETPVYYDTKSPYTKINVIWGGAGRAMTDIEFARNINPRWNFGFTYRPILVDKQLERKRRGDRQVVGHYYDFQTSYKSKDERYLLLFNFRRTRHRVFENGGVKTDSTDTINAYFDKEASPKMVAAESQQFLRNYHLYNQYSLANALQIYETIDWSREVNYFFHNFSSEDSEISDYFFDHWEKVKADTLLATDMFRFSTFKSESGLKGRAGLLFYNVYYRFRSYSAFYNHDNSLTDHPYTGFNGSPLALNIDADKVPTKFDRKGIEHFLGGRLSFDIDSLTRLSGTAEINQSGNYSIDAHFVSRLLDAHFTQSIVKPGFIYTQFRGAHDFWHNDFDNVTGLKIDGFLKTPFKKLLIAPGLSYTLINNYVYFKKDDYGQEQTVLPQQSASVINIVNPQFKWSVNLTKGIRLSGDVINNLTISDPDGALSIPDWLVNGQISLEDFWFQNNLQVHLGFDVTWRSSYQAMGYDIPIQQYYIQNNETVSDALLIDPFLNAKLKRGRLWVKYHNLMQLIQQTGYIITPGYPGQRNVLDFGFELILFD